MKLLVAFALLLHGATAFPGALTEIVERASSGCGTNSACDQYISIPDSKIGVTGTPTPAQLASRARNQCGALVPCTVPFDAAAQYVSTTGQYVYQSPAASDIRGPCPGLNSAANHGYLPRDGVASIPQTITGLGALWSMSIDLAGFLAAYAVVFDGDLITQTWSIGGPQPIVGGLPLPGTPQGISWSHNKYEGDTSIGRCDAYVNGGDAHSLSPTRFRYAYESGMDDDRYTMDKFAQEMAKNTFRSIQQNPYYFTGLFSTTLVAPAAYNFVIAMMSNHTATNIPGYLDGAMFKTFFGVTGNYPNFRWLPGQERIPENWYKRPRAQPYTAAAGVFGDLLSEFAAYPATFRFGGNTNGVNSYQGVNLANYTNGQFTNGNILSGNNFACLVYEGIQQGLVDEFGGTGNLLKAVNILHPKLTSAFGSFGCPSVAKFNNNDLGVYPGHKYSPTGPATNC